MKLKLPNLNLEADLDPKVLSKEVTTRFMIIVGEIMMWNKRNDGDYKTYRTIAASLHCSHSVFSQYQDLTRNVTVEMICWLHINHGVNANWLITGKGERYYNQEVAQRLIDLEDRMENAELKLGITYQKKHK